MLGIHKINLTQFRNYETLRLDTAGAALVVLTGRNGAGKTNILEAISLLTPGRGLRSATSAEFRNKQADVFDMWAVSAEASSPAGDLFRVGTGSAENSKKRAVRINGKDAKGAGALADYMAAVWLTPQMDRIFIEGPSARRKFLDRLVFALDAGHAGVLNRFEKNLRERLRLLTDFGTRADQTWLDVLESKLSADSVHIASARQNMLEHLAAHIARMSRDEMLFPAPRFALKGWLDEALLEKPALDVEEELKDRFKRARPLDAAAGKNSEGAGKTDFIVHYAAKDMPAEQSSTGEQKALLLSIVLSHAAMIRAEKGYVPLLLLDEVAAHLDVARRLQLFAHLARLGGQVWMTGTDAAIFEGLPAGARFFHVDDGKVTSATPAAVFQDMALS